MLKWSRRILRIGGSKAVTLPPPLAEGWKEVDIYSDGEVIIIVRKGFKFEGRYEELLKLIKGR